MGALWGPRGAQRAIFEHFRVHLGPPFGDILGTFLLLFSTSFSYYVFGGPGAILDAVWACFSDIKHAFTEQVRFMKIYVFLSKYRCFRGLGGLSGDEEHAFFWFIFAGRL